MNVLCTGQERDVQKNYWIEHTSELTVEAMMLDSKAADLDKEERPEVLIFAFFSIDFWGDRFYGSLQMFF